MRDSRVEDANRRREITNESPDDFAETQILPWSSTKGFVLRTAPLGEARQRKLHRHNLPQSTLLLIPAYTSQKLAL
jgi:hypothetical protein